MQTLLTSAPHSAFDRTISEPVNIVRRSPASERKNSQSAHSSYSRKGERMRKVARDYDVGESDMVFTEDEAHDYEQEEDEALETTANLPLGSGNVNDSIPTPIGSYNPPGVEGLVRKEFEVSKDRIAESRTGDPQTPSSMLTSKAVRTSSLAGDSSSKRRGYPASSGSNNSRSKHAHHHHHHHHHHHSNTYVQSSPAQTSRGDRTRDGDREKESLNHLLNFSLPPREKPTQYYSTNASSGVSKPYSKDRFVHANFQFVIRNDRAPEIRGSLLDPDRKIEWDLVELVTVTNTHESVCPICLCPPAAAKMTRCGHVFCWACILRYLLNKSSSSPAPSVLSSQSATMGFQERKWRKCPICHESVYRRDLRSVSFRNVESLKEKKDVTWRLMFRDKDALFALPIERFNKADGARIPNSFPSAMDGDARVNAKVTLASPEWILSNVIECEKQQLELDLKEMQSYGEVTAADTIRHAMEDLREREAGLISLIGLSDSQSNVSNDASETTLVIPPPLDLPPVYTLSIPQEGSKSNPAEPAFSSDEDGENPGRAQRERKGKRKIDWSEQNQNRKDGGVDVGNSSSSSDRHGDRVSAASSTGSSSNSEFGDGVDSVTSVSSIAHSPACDISHSATPSPASSPEGLKPMAHQTDRNQGSSSDLTQVTSQQSRMVQSQSPFFFFYQASDGQHFYLHPLNIRMLKQEFGSYERFPPFIQARILEIQESTMTEESRKKLKYLAHLPLSCDLAVCEIALDNVVGNEVMKTYADELKARDRRRQEKTRREARDHKRLEAEAAAAAAAAALDASFYPPLPSDGVYVNGSSSAMGMTGIRDEDFPTPSMSPAPAWNVKSKGSTSTNSTTNTQSNGAQVLSFAMAAAGSKPGMSSSRPMGESLAELSDTGRLVGKGKKTKMVLSMGGARRY